MLQAGQTNNVTFRVNVMGTSAEPKVRVTLGTTPEISFAATMADGSWTAQLNIPEAVAGGSYDLRVEVILNNRIFVPVNKKVQIIGFEGASPEVQDAIAPSTAPSSHDTIETAPETLGPTAPAEAKAIVPRSSLMADLNPAPAEIVMPKVIAKMPQIIKKSDIAAPKAPATLEALSDAASRVVKRMIAPISSGMPKGTGVKAESIKIKISEIDAVSAKEVSKIVESKMKPVKAKIKAQGSSVVRLIKEHVFYE